MVNLRRRLVAKKIENKTHQCGNAQNTVKYWIVMKRRIEETIGLR